MTATEWLDRLLGESKDVLVPVVTCFVGTGNNTAIYGDCLRRVVVTMMESPFEDPENRPLDSYKYPERAGRLLEYVEHNRSELLSACLTILRAYQVAGCPDHPTWGSYEEWARVVAGAITWLELPDPCKSAERLSSEAATDRSQLGELLTAWRECFGSEPQTAATVMAECRRSMDFDDDQAQLTHAVLQMAGDRDGKLPSPIAFGKRLAKFVGRVAGGAKLVNGELERGKTRTWRVVEQAEVIPADQSRHFSPKNGSDLVGAAGIAGIASDESRHHLAAEKGSNVTKCRDAGIDLNPKENLGSTLHDGSTTAPHDDVQDHTQISSGVAIYPGIPATRAEVLEMIDQKLAGIDLANPGTSRHIPAAATPAPIPATPAPIPFEQIVASQAAAQAAAQAQAEREAIARQYLAMCERAQQQQRTPPPPPEFPEDVGEAPTPEQLAYRRHLLAYARVCANLERMYGNG